MKSDSGACNSGCVAAAKIALEQPVTITFGDADAMVANLDHQAPRLLARDNLDRTSCRRILEGI